MERTEKAPYPRSEYLLATLPKTLKNRDRFSNYQSGGRLISPINPQRNDFCRRVSETLRALGSMSSFVDVVIDTAGETDVILKRC
jgi:hypothetical protein